ncbi:ATP-dependent DNA helicase Rep, partial [Bifidobacterium pseudocatenulatum]|nr:ATP-dependent DNA helicase Rep [Bifidobacterium pseudocatenulatum]
KLSECAILYRSNAQSRLFEEQLMAQQIPYHIYGGQRFFDRLEIKDSIAYLRLMNNHQDDAAFERIVNKPKRKIGNTSL